MFQAPRAAGVTINRHDLLSIIRIVLDAICNQEVTKILGTAMHMIV
jgi:hypothetical protein